MAKKEVEEDPPVDDSWLASYADAMTLLMAFFIMMFAFALVDEAKFLEMKIGVVAAIGIADPVTDNTSSILGKGEGIAPEIGLAAIPASKIEALMRSVEEEIKKDGTVTTENVEQVKEYFEARFQLSGLADFVGVEITDRGIVVRFEGRLLFESGSDSLTGDADLVLTETALALKNFDNMVDIEGHTDDRPTGRSSRSNWHLSSARASTVVVWLTERGDVENVRLRPVGFGETVPRESNDTADGRQANRRVEMVILVDGLLESDIDLIDAIPDNIVGPPGTGEKSVLSDGATDDAAPSEDAPFADSQPEDSQPDDVPSDEIIGESETPLDTDSLIDTGLPDGAGARTSVEAATEQVETEQVVPEQVETGTVDENAEQNNSAGIETQADTEESSDG